MHHFLWLGIGVLIALSLSTPVMIWITRRTTQRVRQLEQRTRSAERLAELGTLTSGLAHEIKNPLSTIGLNLQLLSEIVDDIEMDAAEKHRLLSRIATVIGESKRLRDILEDFLSFAGRIRLDAHSTDLNQTLQDLIDFYYPQAEASGIQLRGQFDPAIPPIPIDTTLLKQAILNLLINATQAMVEARYSGQPNGGAADIFIRTAPTDEGIQIEVIDTGMGIHPDNLDKIFHPYFSTKANGSGLGLSTTRRVINEHGGTIEVESKIGSGTNFTIYLPQVSPIQKTPAE